MMTRWIWLGFMLLLSACTPSDEDNNATDMGSDATPDLNRTAEKCEAILYNGDPTTLYEFYDRCLAAGCAGDRVWPTYEKGGKCFFEDAETFKCFSADLLSDQGAASYVNRETGEILVFNSGYSYIDGWRSCQNASSDDEDAMPADHICWTCAPDWTMAL